MTMVAKEKRTFSLEDQSERPKRVSALFNSIFDSEVTPVELGNSIVEFLNEVSDSERSAQGESNNLRSKVGRIFAQAY